MVTPGEMPMSRTELTTEQTRTRGCVLDGIIPPSGDGRLPGAGAVGVAAHGEAAQQPTPELLAMLVQGLDALDAAARQHGGRALADLPQAQQVEVIDRIAASEHALPPIVMLHAYTGYYHHPRVLAALGLETRPPHPGGYTMEPNDLTLLDAVRARPAMFRRR
jgi:hypothetical protein